MSQFIERVVELLGPFGTVVPRPMFGGYGVYLDGLMFALVMDDSLYLKADAINRVEFESAGWQALQATRGGRRATYRFYRVPDSALESAEQMLPWARSAYAAAMRTRSKIVSASKRARPGKIPAATPRRSNEAAPARPARAGAKAGKAARAARRRVKTRPVAARMPKDRIAGRKSAPARARRR